MSDSPNSPEEAYRHQVAAIVGANPAASRYEPATEREPFVRNRSAPKSLDRLARCQLEKMFRGQDLARGRRRQVLWVPNRQHRLYFVSNGIRRAL